MPKKEKAPKAKKEKKPKVKKEKGKGGKKKLLLLLIPLLLAAGVVVFLFLTGKLGGKKATPDEPPPEEQLEEPAAEPEPAEEKEPEPTMTTEEAVDFILNLSPKVLGLDTDTLEGYSAHSTSGVYPVDGLPCTQINVYKTTAVGTNDIQGCYLLSRGSIRRLYKLNPVTNEVTELPLE